MTPSTRRKINQNRVKYSTSYYMFKNIVALVSDKLEVIFSNCFRLFFVSVADLYGVFEYRNKKNKKILEVVIKFK